MSAPQPNAPKCVICGKPQDAAIRPFCSRRCADLDLSRWLRGRYFIPGAGTDDEDAPWAGGDGEPSGSQ